MAEAAAPDPATSGSAESVGIFVLKAVVRTASDASNGCSVGRGEVVEDAAPDDPSEPSSSRGGSSPEEEPASRHHGGGGGARARGGGHRRAVGRAAARTAHRSAQSSWNSLAERLLAVMREGDKWFKVAVRKEKKKESGAFCGGARTLDRLHLINAEHSERFGRVVHLRRLVVRESLRREHKPQPLAGRWCVCGERLFMIPMSVGAKSSAGAEAARMSEELPAPEESEDMEPAVPMSGMLQPRKFRARPNPLPTTPTPRLAPSPSASPSLLLRLMPLLHAYNRSCRPLQFTTEWWRSFCDDATSHFVQ